MLAMVGWESCTRDKLQHMQVTEKRSRDQDSQGLNSCQGSKSSRVILSKDHILGDGSDAYFLTDVVLWTQ